MKNNLQKLGLNLGNSIVIGSGILQALGVRESKDIDLVVKEETFRKLKNTGKFETTENQNREILKDNKFEIGANWLVLGETRTFENLLNDSIVIEGVRYLTLEFLYKAKKDWIKNDKNPREKDINDVKLIEKYFKDQLKKAYNKDAKRRDGAEGKRAQWKVNVRQKFVDFLKEENKKTVLELGSGAGHDSRYFQDQGFEVLATDLSPEMVKMCKKRGLNAKVVDLYDLASLNQKFDGVFSMNVLLHVPKSDINEVLDNIFRVLNKEGIFFYGVYGGYDKEETTIDKSKMGMSRSFSFLSDQTILEVVKENFDIIDFQKIDFGSTKPNFHFQSLLLRKK